MRLHLAKMHPTALALAALLLAAPATWAGGDETFKARLRGSEEVPPVATDTKGKFEIEFNRAHTEAEMTLSVKDGERITQAHLHCGAAGVNGPIVVFVAGLNAKGYDVDGSWISNAIATNSSFVDATPPTGCGTTLTELADAIRQGKVYVNVHSVDFPAGVIRGQLEPDDHHH